MLIIFIMLLVLKVFFCLQCYKFRVSLLVLTAVIIRQLRTNLHLRYVEFVLMNIIFNGSIIGLRDKFIIKRIIGCFFFVDNIRVV